jgi:hypothetical protein
MRLLWIALVAGLTLPGATGAAAPDHCPPPKPHAAKAAHKAVHHQHRRKHREPEPHYYDEEYRYEPLPPPLPLPPPPPIWRDGYGKPYAMGPRPWAAPAPCPCPPDRRGGLPDVCRFNVWFGYNGHYGLESGL